MKSLTTLAALATFAAGAITIAHADATAEVRTQTVRFTELDTTQPYGAAVLFQRTKIAAESVCRDLEPSRSLSLREPYANCVHVALSDAVTAINRPAVTAYAADHGVSSAEPTIKIARD